jgi:hypothetical protein
VTLVTSKPFIGLFKRIMSLVGPLYFDHGDTLLESTFQNIASWYGTSHPSTLCDAITNDVVLNVAH